MPADQLVQSRIGSLHAGVSRQAPLLRSPSQMQEIINLIPSVELGGLADRVGATSVACFAAANYKSTDHFLFRTNDGNRFAAMSGSAPGTIRVIDIVNGIEVPVNVGPYVQQYLAAGGGNNLRFLQILDTILILNPSVAVRWQAPSVGEPDTRAYITIKKLSSGYQTFYVNSSAGSASVVYDGSGGVKTRDFIAQQLQNSIAQNMPGLGVTRIQNVLRVTGPAAMIASLVAGNDWDQTAMTCAKSRVTSLDDLPPVMFSGEPILVDLGSNDRTTAYWVTYDQGSNSYKETSWLDNSATSGTFDQSTMPVRLHQTGTSSFELMPVDWSPRKAGDDFSNPPPPFVNDTLRDLALWKGRLWFASPGWICASQPDDMFNWLGTTARESLPSDPIKKQVDGDLGGVRYLESLRDTLLVFTDNAQGAIDGSTPPTPQNISIGVATRYTTDAYCNPVVIGDATYFTGSEEGRSVLWEYQFSQQGETNSATDLSLHVPRYCPGSIRVMSGSAQSGRIFLSTPLDPSTLYVYSGYKQDGQRKQMAWSKVSFKGVGNIWTHWVDNGNLYVIAAHTSGGYMQVFWLPLNSNSGENRSLDLRLDFKRYVQLVWNPTFNRYEFALPVGFEGLPDLRVCYPNDVSGWWDSYTPALAWTGNQWIGYFQTGLGANLNTVQSAYVGSTVYRGMTFSPFYPSAGESGNTPMGRYQVHKIHVDALKAGDFNAVVQRPDRGDAGYALSPRVTGSALQPHTDGNMTYGFPVNAEGKKVTVILQTDSTYPFIVTGYTLDARYTNPRS